MTSCLHQLLPRSVSLVCGQRSQRFSTASRDTSRVRSPSVTGYERYQPPEDFIIGPIHRHLIFICPMAVDNDDNGIPGYISTYLNQLPAFCQEGRYACSCVRHVQVTSSDTRCGVHQCLRQKYLLDFCTFVVADAEAGAWHWRSWYGF